MGLDKKRPLLWKQKGYRFFCFVDKDMSLDGCWFVITQIAQIYSDSRVQCIVLQCKYVPLCRSSQVGVHTSHKMSWGMAIICGILLAMPLVIATTIFMNSSGSSWRDEANQKHVVVAGGVSQVESIAYCCAVYAVRIRGLWLKYTNSSSSFPF